MDVVETVDNGVHRPVDGNDVGPGYHAGWSGPDVGGIACAAAATVWNRRPVGPSRIPVAQILSSRISIEGSVDAGSVSGELA